MGDQDEGHEENVEKDERVFQERVTSELTEARCSTGGSGESPHPQLFKCALADGVDRFIFWGMAYLTLHPGAKKWAGIWRSMETLLNYAIIIFGFYILIAGSYVRSLSRI